MFSWLDKKMLGDCGSWNHESKILGPERQILERSAVLIHGFIGSPFDMKPLGEHLAEKGARVVIPAMPGQNYTFALKRRRRYSKSFYRLHRY